MSLVSWLSAKPFPWVWVGRLDFLLRTPYEAILMHIRNVIHSEIHSTQAPAFFFGILSQCLRPFAFDRAVLGVASAGAAVICTILLLFGPWLLTQQPLPATWFQKEAETLGPFMRLLANQNRWQKGSQSSLFDCMRAELVLQSKDWNDIWRLHWLAVSCRSARVGSDNLQKLFNCISWPALRLCCKFSTACFLLHEVCTKIRWQIFGVRFQSLLGRSFSRREQLHAVSRIHYINIGG